MKRILAGLLGLILCLSVVLPALAEEIASEILVEEELAANDFTVGNIVTFGDYEQDNNDENGEEPIEWIVLAKDGDYVLLLSLYVLDAQQYYSFTKKMTWKKSDVRRWLNYTFINEAFIVEERNRILTTTVVTDGCDGYESYGCDDTSDQVFLLSYDEVEQYLPLEEDRIAYPTEYAIAAGAYVDEDTGATWWWLRTAGYNNTNACGVRIDGRISGYGSREIYRTAGIRPAIWVNIGDTDTDDTTAE